MAYRFKVLLSFHYHGKMGLEKAFRSYFGDPCHYPNVFVDSGAFSALTQKVTIDIDAYAQWILENRRFIDTYANLDVIGDADATYKNQQYLERRYNLKPLPVFHVGEEWRYLDQYIDDGHRYIALGGMVPYVGRPKILMPWLIRCFKTAERTGVKFHGFGMTGIEIMRSLPFYSVDSSSWLNAARHMAVILYDHRRNMTVQKDIKLAKAVHHNAPLFRANGLDWRDFLEGGEWRTRSRRIAVSIQSYEKVVDHIYSIFGEQHHPTDPTKDKGLLLYFAISGLSDPRDGYFTYLKMKGQAA